MFYCWHWCQSLTVSSVVGAPWRCGVLTTLGGIAGNGLGRLFGREHASTPQSGAEAPRYDFSWQFSCKKPMEIVEDFAETSYNNGKPWKSSGFSCEAKNLRNLQRFHRFFIFLYVFHFFFVSFFSFLHFSFFLLFSFCFFFFFHFVLFSQSSEQTPKTGKKSSRNSCCKNDVLLLWKFDFSASVNRQKRLGKAHLRVTPLSSFCISFWIFP